MSEHELVTLTDGRVGYFYRSRMCGNLIFQPTVDGLAAGTIELADEDHEVARVRADGRAGRPW